MSINSDIEITVEAVPDVEILVDVVPSVDLTVAETSVEIQVGDAPINTISVEVPPAIGLTVTPPPENTVSVGAPNNVTINVDWAGPPGEPGLPGPPGPTAVSADVDNMARLGSDSLIFVPMVDGGGSGVTDHGLLTGLADDDHPQYLTQARGDTRYVNTAGDVMTGLLEVPDLKISGGAEPGLVWTAEAVDGTSGWQEPSALVVAETSDPVLINWFDNAAEGWAHFGGTGSMAYLEMDSPSMPGVLDCQGDVWAEWRASDPMVFEPGALYRITVRARMDVAGQLSFGLQCYNAATPYLVVDTDNAHTALKPHFCAVNLLPGDDAWEDDVLKPGRWLSWTGYLSGRASGPAENLLPPSPVPDEWPPEQPLNQAPAEVAVIVAQKTMQWRPVFHSLGHVWVDAIEIHRLDRSLELPGGIRASDVYAGSVNTESLTTTKLIVPPSTDGYVLTAVDDAGNAEWQYPPIMVSEGPPVRSNLLTPNQETGTDALGDTTGWCFSGGATGAVMARDTSVAAEGTGSLKWTCGLTTTVTVSPHPTINDKKPVTPDETYTFVASVRSTTVERWRLNINWYQSNGTTLSAIRGSDALPYEPATSEFVSRTLTVVAPSDAAFALLMVSRESGLVGSMFWTDRLGWWQGPEPYPDAPENPLTVNLGTSHGRQSCIFYAINNLTTITTTVQTTRVPGSKAVQFTLVEPAMVTCRMITYFNIMANSTASIYANVGVIDEEGTFLFTDDWSVAATSHNVGTAYARISTGGQCLVSGAGLWRRFLQPGTYTVYPRSWISAIDAASEKKIGATTIEIDIDPGMTYLTGQRP